jgi:CheY-like chemotaxis protein
VSGINVLVAEDDPDVREWLTLELTNVAGVGKIYAVTNGPELQTKLAHGRFDLVVSDIAMPGKNGLAVAEEARAAGDTTPFVFITGYVHQRLAKRVKAVGKAALLQKPTTMREIVDEAVRLLGCTWGH